MVIGTPRLIHHFLESSARHLPDKIALVHDEVRASYRQINGQANRLAGFFGELGLRPGDRLALLLDNGLEYVVAYYAALKAGLVVVPLNTELKGDGLSDLLREIEAKAMVSSRKFERLLRSLDPALVGGLRLVVKNPKLELPHFAGRLSWDEVIGDGVAEDPALAIDPASLACIIYTSGSTSRPKGVMLSHGNIVANVSSICQYLQLGEDDVQMVVLPFFYVMGKSLLNSHFAVGGRVVINNKFAYPATVINQMVAERVTGFSGVPSTYSILLHQSPLAEARHQLTSLRYCSQAGGHMAASIKRRLLDILPEGTKLVIMYGATEAGARLAWVDPQRLADKLDSIGRPIPGVELKVLDRQGGELADHEVGELVASGANIMLGYWRNPQATGEALSEYGYHTGDLGYRDGEGYFYVVGRKDNQLKVGGHRVNPQYIEEVIMASELAEEVAVIGLADEILGTRLAVLLVAPGRVVEAGTVLKACAAALPGYLVPQEVLMVDALPKNASGKIDRQGCEELFYASRSGGSGGTTH